MRRLGPLAVLLMLVAWVPLPAGAAGKKKPPSPSSAIETAVSKALDAGQDQVSRCVLTAGPPKGSSSVRVKLKVSVNGAGQVLSLKLALEPEVDSTHRCVEQVVRSLTFPRSSAPLIAAERDWTFSFIAE